jgi:glycosyltransferase involved in cell wall biosynthesis
VPALDRVTPLILTLDEEPNIARVLEQLRWAERIVVVDSFSRDRTPDIVRGWPGADLYKRHFDSFADQWNYGLNLVTTEWVLSLDADYIVPEALGREILALGDNPPESAFYAEFDYVVAGRPLRGTLYPPRRVLFRRDRARFADDGHRQVLEVDGHTGLLSTRIFHDDRKPLGRWIASQRSYAEREADKLLSADPAELSAPDRIRRTGVLGPPAVALYCLLIKGLLLDGWRGWYYTMQRVAAETILTLRLIERRFLREGDGE